MAEFDTQISDRMRDRIQEILVADGLADTQALVEANSLVDGLGYYHRVTASTGLKINRAYGALEVRGPEGDLLAEIPFERNDAWED